MWGESGVRERMWGESRARRERERESVCGESGARERESVCLWAYT